MSDLKKLIESIELRGSNLRPVTLSLDEVLTLVEGIRRLEDEISGLDSGLEY